MKNKTLIIYFKNGTTALFQNVEELELIDDTYLSFKYFGQSTQVKRKAIFVTNNIACWAEEIS
ncbi:hypothetical protein [Vagococcus xieshaowenii]|uniref:Uncharacterized protein n=1 Tax=Vagococcus xieshaowenii TaxID=2562451 RepID=A0AAJ5EFU2_9ENTE|nr:hypothetical protein [Vagococcus xieshaowenii]QCA28247.1 hypothetical protein E4Z98_02545 [Vagococcus xieshaowenii]TFZ41901.1 hypothetical protein E4031_04725 [Vagococcus xieshaowenii]